MGSVRAELLLLAKRPATWVLVALPIVMSLLFGYILPYSSYVSGPPEGRPATDLRDMLPERMVPSLLEGVPFYLGMVALILGVLAVGSEYGWGTLKTVLMQQPRRLHLFGAKLAAVAAVLAVSTVSIFAVAAVSSSAVAWRENAPADWPAAWDVARGMGAAWLILTLWAMFGVLLAVLSRGTALAIGLGILYGLVVEGLIAGLGSDLPLVQDAAQAFLRTNGYSLVAPLGASVAEGGEPGAFAGPFVAARQALLVILGYLVLFAGVSALVIRRRDVT